MLHDLLEPTLTQDPERSVLEYYGRFWTARQLDDSAQHLAAGLVTDGVVPIDRVAVLLPNCPETVLTYLACFKANFVDVPLDYRHQAMQVKYAINHSGANVLVVHCDRIAELEEEGVLPGIGHVLVVGDDVPAQYQSFAAFIDRKARATFQDEFEGDELCVMIYTSGTTSRPKGVTLTRSAIAAGIKKYLARVPLNSKDVALIAAPITRPMALRSQLLPILYVGGCAALISAFDPDEYVAALKRLPAKTFLALLPSALSRVVAHPDIGKCDFSALRLCMAGGDRVPLKLHEAFEQLTGVAITEQCGSSEVGAYALNPPFGHKKQGSIGLPMYGVQVCIVDQQGDDVPAGEIGEIIVSSPLMMDGYWNDTALTKKTMDDGWVYTGDLGRFDDDGYLWFMGRKKDVIVRGGSNISPLEVEAVLNDHSSVAESCVVGVTDVEEETQEVHAYVVLEDGETVSEEQLREFAAERLAEYMLPAKIRFIDEMPQKGAGKVDRDLLRLRAETDVMDL